jgi:hypothetical protein
VNVIRPLLRMRRETVVASRVTVAADGDEKVRYS